MAVMAASVDLSPADAWVGTGLRLPLLPTRQAPNLRFVSGAELVRQSIQIIMFTQPGERVMMPEFGCGLSRFVMAPNTVAIRTAIREEVSQALALWEPRIRVTEVKVTPSEDEPTLVWIDISYVRLVDLRPDNLVYPFYLR
jgi:phage baseplate assembly protein W